MGLARSHEVSLISTRSTSRSHLALFKVLACDVGRSDVSLLQERVVHPLARTHQPVHLQLFHAAVGAYAQLSARVTYLWKYELLQLRIALENMPSNSASHLEDAWDDLVSSPDPSPDKRKGISLCTDFPHEKKITGLPHI